MKLWRIRGNGQNGACELTVRAADHNEAVRIASRRRIRVESCVLIQD